jgi:hypothetical protein
MSQILRVSSRCSLTISVWVRQPHTVQKLTILIQNYYKVLQNLLCLQNNNNNDLLEVIGSCEHP